MTGFEMDPAFNNDESASELRNLLNRMWVEQLKVQETQAIQAAKADPAALHRYRELQARRRKLEADPPQPG
jgi:DNA primase